ncbi:MAG: pantoate--beta-alanine ligase, partial [Xanthomonadales bacterium]|nr:pantoate--beta-alanine ligase [Xanthomonadales bacterium]
NQFLDARQREQASVIHRTLLWMRDRWHGDGRPLAEIESEARDRLGESGLLPDYAVIRRSEDLAEPAPRQSTGLVALIAARLGSVRLIDNLQFDD